jgi:hypothetical protein
MDSIYIALIGFGIGSLMFLLLIFSIQLCGSLYKKYQHKQKLSKAIQNISNNIESTNIPIQPYQPSYQRYYVQQQNEPSNASIIYMASTPMPKYTYI